MNEIFSDADRNTLFWLLYKALPKEPNGGKFWTDGEEILCRDEEAADFLADLFDTIYGESVVNTGYYDPKDDERSGETDRYTGWYYCTFA